MGGQMEDQEPYRADILESCAAKTLADFMRNRMQMQHVYQPVLLKVLLLGNPRQAKILT